MEGNYKPTIKGYQDLRHEEELSTDDGLAAWPHVGIAEVGIDVQSRGVVQKVANTDVRARPRQALHGIRLSPTR